MRWPEWVLIGVLLALRPASANEAYAELYRLYDYPRDLSREAVPVCSHHGCEQVARVALDDATWRRIASHFEPPAADAAAEREQIRQAVAEMETVMGVLAGTAHDRGGDLSGIGVFKPQLDCIDESSNTTTYLTLFEQAGLLRWHSVQPRAHRGYLFFGGWPHFTARIEEHDNGREWVVDSWFRDNGALPDVVDLQTWKAGWKPEGFVF